MLILEAFTVRVVAVVAEVTAVNVGIIPAPQMSSLCRQVIKASSSPAISSEHHHRLVVYGVKVTAVGVLPVPLSGLLDHLEGQISTLARQVDIDISVVLVVAL